MGRFNLLDEPWITVMPADGSRAETVSLLTLFREAHRYQRLAGEMVTQDFAVLRLLLAVLTTVFTRFDADGKPYPFVELDGRDRQTNNVDEDDLEEDEYEETMTATWETLWQRGCFPEIVSIYLEAWRDRFFLFDETYPFYQVRREDFERYDMMPKKSGSKVKYGTLFPGRNMNRLISESANKVSLFSPKDEDGKDKMDLAELARWLIMFQGYVGTGDKSKFPKVNGTMSKGWLYDIGGICMAGDNLFETLLMNLVLCHPAEQDIRHRQSPCWEWDAGAYLDKLLRGEQPDNLAELYTNWARAVWIDPETQANAAICLDMVKVPGIIHEEQVLELMTLWKTPSKKGDQTHLPCKHIPEQAMWRSFGLITLNRDNGDSRQRRPGILDQYDAIRDLVGDQIVHLWAVSMRDDGNATSWVPVDEVVDVLNLNEMVITDQGDDGWCVRIDEAVDITKKVVEQVYRIYIKEVAIVRNIGREDSKGKSDAVRKAYIESKKEDIYAEIDRPFRDWLESIRPEDDKDAQIRRWKENLERLVLWQARSILESGSHWDYVGHVVKTKEKDKKSKVINIATAYNQFCRNLKWQMKNS
jgi:CRISPR system Cascade subunit CasA